jgi:gas vesicle protein
MTENKNKELVIGAVVGSVLGAVTALLFAPKSGRELRSDIKEGCQQVSEKTQEVAGSVVEKSKELASSISEKTQTAVQTVGRTTSEWAGKAKDVAVQVGQEVKSWKGGKTAENGLESAEASIAATVAQSEEKAQ